MSHFSADRRQFFRMTAATAAVTALLPGLSHAADSQSISPVYPLNAPGEAWDVFKAYDPETDPSAPFYRSHVKRAGRIAPLNATQAQPGLKPEVSAATLFAAYLTLEGPDEDLNRERYQTGARSRPHVERFWQYLDVVVGWNTTGLVPNPAMVDAAHRNGAICLGCIFQPDVRMFNGADLPRPEVAKKLVKLCQYFGFDGYFVNFESYTAEDARAIQDLIANMKTAAAQAGFSDFHIQYYDGYTDVKSVWPGPPHVDGSERKASEPRADSMMIDQGWSNYGLTRGCCSGHALTELADPAKTGGGYDQNDIYYGLQLYPGPGYMGLVAPRVIAPNGGPSQGGLQIYSVEDGLRKMRRARVDQLKALKSPTPADRVELLRLTDPNLVRKSWYRLHQSFWSGKTGSPANGNNPTPAQLAIYGNAERRKVYTDYQAPGQASDQLRLPITYGVANFIVERSVVGSLPFVTRFNTGEGARFFHEGVQTGGAAWFNLGIQDILPSWAWWTKGVALDVDYDFTDAWDGGSSLCVAGTLDQPTEVRLYKTEVALTASSNVGLVYKGGSKGRMKVGLAFKDAPTQVEWIAVTGGKALKNGWLRWHENLGQFAGRTLVTVSLGFEGAGAYKVNIGELSLLDDTILPPVAISDFRVEKSKVLPDGKSAELRLQWDGDAGVDAYDLFAGTGKDRVWLGRISGNAYYVAKLPRGKASTTTLSLAPIIKGAEPMHAATTTFDWT
jgi:endo-beta-N-acetylglucosaminidase D